MKKKKSWLKTSSFHCLRGLKGCNPPATIDDIRLSLTGTHELFLNVQITRISVEVGHSYITFCIFSLLEGLALRKAMNFFWSLRMSIV